MMVAAYVHRYETSINMTGRYLGYSSALDTLGRFVTVRSVIFA